jgi:hypothetical protein
VNRMKSWEMTPNGNLITCTACSWSAPMKGQDIGSADQEFESHACADHPAKGGTTGCLESPAFLADAIGAARAKPHPTAKAKVGQNAPLFALGTFSQAIFEA